MQGSLKGNPKFDCWYAQKQAELRCDALAKFFHDFRTVTQHLGVNVVGGGSQIHGFHQFYFVACPDLQVVPEQDVLTACETYFRSVLSLVFECYEVMGPTVHGKWYFKEQHFASRGLSVEDADEELGLPRGGTDIGRPDLLAYRWELLRRQADGCLIEGEFLRWLGKALPKPPKLAPMPQ